MTDNVKPIRDDVEDIKIPDVILVNGKRCETSKARPLSLGDQRKLKAAGANLRELDKSGDPDTLAQLLLVFCRKMNPDITEEDVDELTNKDMRVLGKLIGEIDQRSIDRPT